MVFILKDGNSITDQSGNSNNLTVGGGTLTKTEDCPSNVFATLNPLVRWDSISHIQVVIQNIVCNRFNADKDLFILL